MLKKMIETRCEACGEENCRDAIPIEYWKCETCGHIEIYATNSQSPCSKCNENKNI